MSHRLLARHGIHHFHLRVPALDALFQVDGKDADIDRLDDILVELLQPLVLGDLLLQAGVEASILNGDTDVAGHGFQQLHVLAGEEVSMRGAPQPDDGDGLLLQAAGKVVVEIEQGSRLPLNGGEVEYLLRVLEEDVGACIGLIEVEKFESRAAVRGEELRRQSVAGHQGVTAIDAGKKDGDARHQQSLRQPVHDRIQQSVQIGLRAQAAAKGDQGLAVVIALAVKDPVDPVLNGSLERLEKLGGNNDGGDQAPRSGARQASVHHFRRESDRTEVKANQCSRCQGIGDAALENQVDVHQAVADDRPAKGKGQKDQANAPQPFQNAGNRNAG